MPKIILKGTVIRGEGGEPIATAARDIGPGQPIFAGDFEMADGAKPVAGEMISPPLAAALSRLGARAS